MHSIFRPYVKSAVWGRVLHEDIVAIVSNLKSAIVKVVVRQLELYEVVNLSLR